MVGGTKIGIKWRMKNDERRFFTPKVSNFWTVVSKNWTLGIYLKVLYFWLAMDYKSGTIFVYFLIEGMVHGVPKFVRRFCNLPSTRYVLYM